MADQKVTISVTTLGNTAGADAVSKSLKNVSVSAGTLNDKVSVSTWGVYDLDKAVTKSAGSAGKVPAVANAAAAATKKWGFIANQAGVQLGDLTTQVSMGTSVARAFSMQAPQMLGLLSTAGVVSTKMALALTGVGAAIPIITMAAPALMSFLTGTTEKADDAANKIEGLGEKLAKISSDKTAKINQDLEDAETMAQNLRESTGAVEAARAEAAKAAISDDAILAAAEQNINVILGIRVDKLKQLREEHRRAAETRDQEMREKAEADQREIAELQAKLADRTATIEGKKARLQELEAQAARGESMLAKLMENKASQEAAIADEPATFLWDTWMGRKMYDPATSKAKQQAADEARRRLPTTESQIEEQTAAGKADSEAVAGLKRTIMLMESAAGSAAKAIDDKAAAAAIILDKLAKTDAKRKLLEESEEPKANADNVRQAVEQLERFGTDDLAPTLERIKYGFGTTLRQLATDPQELAPTIASLKRVMDDNVVAATEAADVRLAAKNLSRILKDSVESRSIISALEAVAAESIRQDARAKAIQKQIDDLKRNPS